MIEIVVATSPPTYPGLALGEYGRVAHSLAVARPHFTSKHCFNERKSIMPQHGVQAKSTTKFVKCRSFARVTTIALGIVYLALSSLYFLHYQEAYIVHHSSLSDYLPQFFQKNTRKNATRPPENNLQLNRPASQILQNSRLPDLIKSYASWHRQQRRLFFEAKRNNSLSSYDIRFLISRCLKYDKCGGASDRLQDMPYNLMIANETNRVLLVKWEKPLPLERFLVPPEGGIDWTVPDGMFDDDEDFHVRGKESGDEKIVSRIRRDSAAPIFRKYENEVVGHKM